MRRVVHSTVVLVLVLGRGVAGADDPTAGQSLQQEAALQKQAAAEQPAAPQPKATREQHAAGELRLGRMKAEKILFLGNSITAVPQRNMRVWWGLSASIPAKDYAHLLAAAIDAKTGGRLAMIPTTAPTTNPDGSVDQCESNVINIADVFERGYASYDASKISKQLAWKADIVILQFGENIPPATFNADVFRQSLKKLVADLKESSNPHIFFAGYILGSNAAVDEMKRRLCEEDPTHRVFVDLSNVSKDPSHIGEYGHPNDQGMALIAETLFQAILTHSATSTKSEGLHQRQ